MTRPLIAAFIALIVVWWSFDRPALAATRASVDRPVATATARWAAVAVPRGSGAAVGALVLTWTVSQGVAYKYFDLLNVGTLPLSGQSFEVTNVYERTGNVKPPTVTFEACLNGTWSASNTCSGTVEMMGSTTGQFFTTVNTPLMPSARLEVRATTAPGAISSYTTTVNVSVARVQTRSGETTNS